MKQLFTKLIINIALVLLIGLITFSTTPQAQAAPATFTVNVTTDESDANQGDGICETANSGECTLRAAIEEANANEGADTIEFTIPSGGVQTITPGTDLPTISEALIIDGYTNNPGASANTAVAPNPMNGTILIHIVATNISSNVLDVGADDVTIKGLSITECSLACIQTNFDNGVFQGNYVGVEPTGLSIGGGLTDVGISVHPDADNILIGGTNPADRNVVGAEGPDNTTTGGINIAGTNVSVFGNIVGLGKDGVTDLTPQAADVNGLSGNISKGVLALGAGPVFIGGTSTGMTNIFSGSTNNVGVGGQNARVQGNLIGTDYTGEVNLGITNGVGVVPSANANGNLIGGTNTGEGNIIAGVGASGITTLAIYIQEWDVSLNPARNAILGNSIYDIKVLNFEGIGDSNLGIDHSGFTDSSSPPDYLPDSFQYRGPTLNDVGDGDSGPNNLMNFPVLKTAVQTGSDIDITYDLDVAGSDSNEYRVEFFANERSTIFGYGPGQTFLGSHTTSNGSGKSVTLDVGSGVFSNMSLSATVTALDSTSPTGFGDTSEFALNILIGSATDFDADTIPDAVENAAPNSGDGNDDDIQDSLQPTVSSFVSATSGNYITFETGGCFSNGFVDSISEDSLSVTDDGFVYPYGLTDFTLNCSRGDTVTINKYIFTDETDLDGYSVRKFNPNTEEFTAVPDSTIDMVEIGGENTIHLSYQLTDGEFGDDDGEVNGIIVDPVGLAAVFTSSSPPVNNPDSPPIGSNPTTVTGTLPATGANNALVVGKLAMGLIFAGLVLTIKTNFRARYSFDKF